MRRVLISGCLLAVLLFAGCGDDGKDGAAFLSYNWVYAPLYLSDNIPGIPDAIYGGQYYEVSPGTYLYTYTAWDGSSYYGNINVHVAKGKDGGWFKDGDDGKDNYFDIFLYSDGPSMVFTQQSLYDEYLKAGAELISPEISNSIDKASAEGLPSKASDTEVNVIERQQGRYNIRLEYMRLPER